jgi:hypothetical protein
MGTVASTQHPDDPQCVIPNCGNGVECWGEPCQACRTAFGARLRPTAAPALTREQIAERDRDVDRALAQHRQVRAGYATRTASPHPPRRRSA